MSRRALAAGAIALLAALAIAACGGSSSPTTTSSASTPAAAGGTPASGPSGQLGAHRNAFEQCLRKHGVSLPSVGHPGAAFGASGSTGTTPRFGPTGGGGFLRRFGASGPSGAAGFFRRFGASGPSGAAGFFRRIGASGPSGTAGIFRRFGASGPSGAAGFLRRFGATGASSPVAGYPFAASPKLAAAFRACAAELPGAAGRGLARPSAGFSASSAADRAAVRSFVACVRRHGYDMPAPNFSGKGPVFSSTKVNRSSPAFIKASGPCTSLLRFG
ncbi:MAG TPA: hypothetical protein VL977_05695 [Solirubrobacteraceae bacterium]|nr:hypothetical protein [Solirubrobacteraceae bacterium]